jgi:transposase
MSLQSILSVTFQYLRNLSKRRILDALIKLRDQYLALENRNKELERENEQLKAEQTKNKIHAVNMKANQPTSKQPEWEQKGVGNDGIKKRKGRGRQGRKGAGNKSKERPATHHETAKVEKCDVCGRDLSEQPALQTGNARIIEDIPSIPEATQVIEVKMEKKYCTHCSNVVTAVTDIALPGTDIGMNTTILATYLWVTACLPYTRIASYLKDFFGQIVSTAGLASHLIRVANIMKPVQQEIMEDVKQSPVIHADETGWRVDGKLWWLWLFGNSHSAFYIIDKTRSSDVIKKILGEFFNGILVIDGWTAYLYLICLKQSCMAHLLRKIREFHRVYPRYGSVLSFYLKFRKILRDGERLQLKREELGEYDFYRRLGKLYQRLDELLKWPNPNKILLKIIDKVERQRPHILTFVEHKGVPCHNNMAESLIRKGVMKRKVSFGSKSPEGAEAYSILLSIYATCQLRKISFPDFMTKSLKHYIRTKNPLLLTEYMAVQPVLAIAA